MMGGSDHHYMVRRDAVYEASASERGYASQLRDAGQAEYSHVMNMSPHFEGGFDEAVMGAEFNRKMTYSQADEHDMHSAATAESGHIAGNVVAHVRGLFG